MTHRHLAPIAALAAFCAAHAAPPAPAPAAKPAAASPVVAEVLGEKITRAELEKLVHSQLVQLERQRAQQEHEILQRGLEGMVNDKLIAAEAKKRGVTEEALLKAEIDDKAANPGEDEIKQFYEQNKAQIQAPFESIKDRIVQYLAGQKKSSLYESFITKLKAAGNVSLNLPAPELPRMEVAATGPSRGPANAKVTLVIFSDFQCPFCSRSKPVVDQIVKTYGDKVRVVFRDYPLPFHDKAQKAAEAGHCADEQGKFWAMHDAMFDHQDQLALDGLKQLARGAGIDGAKFDACLDSGKFAAAVKKDMEDGQEAGVDGTPAIFVNGQMVAGAEPFETYKAIIDKELARPGA